MSSQPDGLVELGIIAALPERLATSRPDGDGGFLVTLRPGATSTEIASVLTLLPPDVVWRLPPLGGVDDALHLMFVEPERE